MRTPDRGAPSFARVASFEISNFRSQIEISDPVSDLRSRNKAAGLLSSELVSSDRLQAQFARFQRQPRWSKGLLSLQHQLLLLLDQPCAFAAQVFAFVAVVNGGEMLPRGKDEATGQKQAKNEQKRETGEGARVAFAMNSGIALLRRNSFHAGTPGQLLCSWI